MRARQAWFAGACAALVAAGALAANGNASPIPRFDATVLTGGTVSSEQLHGQPTILIVTPSRSAGPETRRWVAALHRNIDPNAVRVRDVLSIDLPFFISESYALERARATIPEKYHDQTWLLTEPVLSKALDIPLGSATAHVLVLDSTAAVVARVSGEPTPQRISEVEKALRNLPLDRRGQSR